MLRSNTGIFLCLPEESGERVLHPAVVIGSRGDSYSATLEEPTLDAEVGHEVLVFFEHDGVFWKQPARIDGILQTEPAWMIGFETIGESSSAESRQCYRVCTAIADVTAKLGPEEGCEVLDVSATGFSAIASRRHPPGAVFPVTLRFENRHFTGTATIQSIRALGPTRFRYGLQCVGDRFIGGKLAKGLQEVSATIQRRHLRRMKGTA